MTIMEIVQTAGATIVPVVVWMFKRMRDLENLNAAQDKDLAAYKLTVEQRYASVAHLQEVEKRLIDEFKGLRHDIRQLSNAMNILAARSPNIGLRDDPFNEVP